MKNKVWQFLILFSCCLVIGIFPGKNTFAEKVPDLVAMKHAFVEQMTPRQQRKKTYMKRQWGIEVLYARQTAGGYMLEFRYKVLDGKKAKPLFERQTKPVMTHYQTGAKLIVPTPAKTGALRNSNIPKSGKTYWMFFANPAKLVKPGDTVGIKIGKFEVTNLVVK